MIEVIAWSEFPAAFAFQILYTTSRLAQTDYAESAVGYLPVTTSPLRYVDVLRTTFDYF